MKTTLYMEVTANGFIAGEEDNTSWISEEAWNSYLKVIEDMDAIVIGKRTYDIMPADEFNPKPLYIVVTHNTPQKPKVSNTLFTDKQPEEIMEFLNDKGFNNICISGGGTLNSLFMERGLVDEIFLDVEPTILGEGIPLFALNNFEYNLELLEVKKLNKNTIQLHYQVINKGDLDGN